MKVVYIAGPFTASTAWQIEQNVRRAEEVALKVAKLGAMPLCPHTNTRFFHGQCTEEFWYEGTLELLRRCDAVYVVEHGDGTYTSVGVTREIYEAKKMQIPVFNAAFDSEEAWAALIEWFKEAEA